MKTFAFFKVKRLGFFSSLKWALISEPLLRGAAVVSVWFSFTHSLKHTDMKHKALLYMPTPSQDCVKHTLTQTHTYMHTHRFAT